MYLILCINPITSGKNYVAVLPLYCTSIVFFIKITVRANTLTTSYALILMRKGPHHHLTSQNLSHIIARI